MLTNENWRREKLIDKKKMKRNFYLPSNFDVVCSWYGC